jgi:hypothetical protein
VKQCDKESTELLKAIEEKGYYAVDGRKFSIDEIPVPVL